MIYGRRLFDKGPESPFQPKPVHRVFRVINAQFQWKYTRYFNLFLIGSLLLFLGPSWYFLQQNYEFMVGIASRTAPQLVEHLQREIQWLTGFAIFSIGVLVVLTTWVSLKMTGNIIGPLISMERHMWKVTTGDWSAHDFKIRSDDDFHELADAYSYLYRSLKAQTETELRALEKIHVDPNQKDSYNALHNLIDLKKAQLRVDSPVGIDEDGSDSTESRRRGPASLRLIQSSGVWPPPEGNERRRVS